MNTARDKAIEMATELIESQWESITKECNSRHADSVDMSFAIQFKIPHKTPNRMIVALRYSTPYCTEISGEIEDPNQPSLFPEGSDE